MTPPELLAEARRRLREPKKGGENWLYFLACSLAGGLLLSVAPLLAFLVFLPGVYFCVRGLFWLLDRSSRIIDPIAMPDLDSQLANRLGGTMIGLCPACQGEIMVAPASDAFDFACPLCGGHLRYEAGVVRSVG